MNFLERNRARQEIPSATSENLLGAFALGSEPEVVRRQDALKEAEERAAQFIAQLTPVQQTEQQ